MNYPFHPIYKRGWDGTEVGVVTNPFNHIFSDAHHPCREIKATFLPVCGHESSACSCLRLNMTMSMMITISDYDYDAGDDDADDVHDDDPLRL